MDDWDYGFDTPSVPNPADNDSGFVYNAPTMVTMHRAARGSSVPGVYSLVNAFSDKSATQVDAMPTGTIARDAVLMAAHSAKGS